MKIDDRTPVKVRGTLSVREIPTGQVFRGTLQSQSTGKRFVGIWYKAQGGWTDTLSDSVRECVVVRLDHAGKDEQGYANIVQKNMLVLEYEPLDVELVIKGVL